MKKTAFWLILSALVMIGLPWLFVACLSSNASMIACLIMFYAANPVYSVIVGLAAGKGAKKHRLLPVMPPLLFIAGVWTVLRANDTVMYVYAAVYLVLAFAAMLLRRKKKKPEPPVQD